MTRDEIQVLTGLAERARQARAEIWKRDGYTAVLRDLDRSLNYRRAARAPEPDPGR